MNEPDPDQWSAERERAVHLSGFLRGLATTDRFAFHDGERANLRASAALIARSIGRPDLAAETGADDAR